LQQGAHHQAAPALMRDRVHAQQGVRLCALAIEQLVEFFLGDDHSALNSKPVNRNSYCPVAGKGDSTPCRRLTSLLNRGFPNPQATGKPTRSNWQRSADLEIGDTAGLETCANVVYRMRLAVSRAKSEISRL